MLDVGSQSPTIWQAALVAKIWCMWVHLLKYGSVFWNVLEVSVFWNIFEVSGDKASDSFCMISGSCWLVHVSKVLDWDSDWFLIHGALSFLKGAANWKGSHWILKFLNDQLIKFEVLLIGFCYQWILWSMVFCSILQSMVRSELFHPVAFCHGFWWSCWSTSFW